MKSKMKTSNLKKFLAGLLSISMIVIGFTGCGAAEKSSESAAKTEDSTVDIRISYWNYNIQGLLFEYAQKWGIFDEVFADDDVNFEFVPFTTGPAANEAITAGEIDFELSLGDQPFLTGNANGVDTVALATTMKQEESYVIVAAPDSGIKSPADLKGKNICVAIGTFSHKSLIGILKDNGIDDADVDLTNFSDDAYGDAVTAISKGNLDAYFGPWVNLKSNLDNGTLVQIGDSTGHPLTTYLVGTNSFVSAHPDLTEKLVKVLYKTEAYLLDNIDKQSKYIAESIQSDEDTTKKFLDKIDLVVNLTDEDIASIKETQKFFIEQNILDEEVADLTEKHINKEIIAKIVAAN